MDRAEDRSRPLLSRPMKIIITIQHPAHVHFFRNSITELQKSGHEVHTFARVKNLVPDLLERYNIDHEILAGQPNSKWQIPLIQAKYEWKLYQKARQISPDVMIAIGEPGITHVGKLTGSTSILFADTEHSRLQKRISVPFADYICTPEGFTDNLGPNHERYPSFHELAYLHPDRYEPDPEACLEYGINPDEKLAVIRLISWNAAHDVGHGGFKNLQTLISELENRGTQVVITAEGDCPLGLEQYRMTVPPHHIHDLLYYADIFVGEGATMAIESAVLGTPAVFVSTLEAGVLNELESEYGLVHTISNPESDKLVNQAVEKILETNPAEWKRRRDELLNEKIDTTSVILDQIESVTL